MEEVVHATLIGADAGQQMGCYWTSITFGLELEKKGLSVRTYFVVRGVASAILFRQLVILAPAFF